MLSLSLRKAKISIKCNADEKLLITEYSKLLVKIAFLFLPHKTLLFLLSNLRHLVHIWAVTLVCTWPSNVNIFSAVVRRNPHWRRDRNFLSTCPVSKYQTTLKISGADRFLQKKNQTLQIWTKNLLISTRLGTNPQSGPHLSSTVVELRIISFRPKAACCESQRFTSSSEHCSKFVFTSCCRDVIRACALNASGFPLAKWWETVNLVVVWRCTEQTKAK
jgi:hypothetical protein